jgi:septum formation protein
MIDLKNYKLVLASQSPRRQHLLKELGLEFDIKTADINEIYPENLKREEIPVYLAEQKANAMLPNLKDDEILITADTIVWLNGKAVNKPKDRQDAFNMITSLSDNTHVVYTGVQLSTSNKKQSFFAQTKVTFSKLEEQEINYYINKFKPFDKAGSYGIQEWIGYIGIEKIEGSYFNVMGLPVHQVYQQLKTFIL